MYCYAECLTCKYYHDLKCFNENIPEETREYINYGRRWFIRCKFYAPKEDITSECLEKISMQDFNKSCSNCCYYLPFSSKCIFYVEEGFSYHLGGSVVKTKNYLLCGHYVKKEKDVNIIRLFYDIKEIEFKKLFLKIIIPICRKFHNKFKWYKFNIKYYIRNKYKSLFGICRKKEKKPTEIQNEEIFIF